jgi:hypothetical protein
MVSMGGVVLVENCEFFDGYNGLECFMLGGAQTLTVSNNIIDINRNGIVPGSYGVAYLGYTTSALTVTGNQIGKCTAGVLVNQMASNVLIDNNDFTDCKAVYGFFGESYVGDPSVDQSQLDRWEDWTISNNTATALTRNVDEFILMFTSPGLNWEISGNTIVNASPYQYSDFLRTSGATGSYIVSGNTIDGNTQPAYPQGGPRAIWTDTNTIAGSFSLGTEINASDAGPKDIYPAWSKVRVSDLSGSASVVIYQIDPANLDDYPEGFILEIRRSGSNDQFSGVEIIPDADWNSLTRGYVLYAGGVLKMTVGVDGKFGLTSWTPNTVSIPTLQQFGDADPDVSKITFYGQLAINLSPTVAHTFDAWSGVAIGETVELNLNGNVTLDHVPGVLEMSNGVDYVSAGTVTLSATRVGDVLEVTIP